MKHLTPTEASRLMFALLQKVRTSTGGGAKLTLATASTLFAALKNPGELQSDIWKEVGGIADSALSRQIDILDGHGRSDSNAGVPPLLRRSREGKSRTNNVIELTEEGEKFAAEFADFFNKLLDRADAK